MSLSLQMSLTQESLKVIAKAIQLTNDSKSHSAYKW